MCADPTRIISSHKAHGDREQSDSQCSVASTERSSDKESSRDAERQRRVKLSGVCDAEVLSVHAPITDDTENHCADPHGNVWQRRVKSILLNVVFQDIRQVFRQVCNDSEVSDSMTNLRSDSEKKFLN